MHPICTFVLVRCRCYGWMESFSQTHCAAVTDDALRGWVKTILDRANYHRLMTKGQADLALFIRDQPLRVNIFMAGIAERRTAADKPGGSLSGGYPGTAGVCGLLSKRKAA